MKCIKRPGHVFGHIDRNVMKMKVAINIKSITYPTTGMVNNVIDGERLNLLYTVYTVCML